MRVTHVQSQETFVYITHFYFSFTHLTVSSSWSVPSLKSSVSGHPSCFRHIKKSECEKNSLFYSLNILLLLFHTLCDRVNTLKITDNFHEAKCQRWALRECQYF